MALQVQIHGGPRDGEYVPYAGPSLRLLVSRPVTGRYVPEDRLPVCDRIPVDEYEIRRGLDGELFYVRRAAGSGA